MGRLGNCALYGICRARSGRPDRLAACRIARKPVCRGVLPFREPWAVLCPDRRNIRSYKEGVTMKKLFIITMVILSVLILGFTSGLGAGSSHPTSSPSHFSPASSAFTKSYFFVFSQNAAGSLTSSLTTQVELLNLSAATYGFNTNDSNFEFVYPFSSNVVPAFRQDPGSATVQVYIRANLSLTQNVVQMNVYLSTDNVLSSVNGGNGYYYYQGGFGVAPEEAGSKGTSGILREHKEVGFRECGGCWREMGGSQGSVNGCTPQTTQTKYKNCQYNHCHYKKLSHRNTFLMTANIPPIRTKNSPRLTKRENSPANWLPGDTTSCQSIRPARSSTTNPVKSTIPKPTHNPPFPLIPLSLPLLRC